MERKGVLISPLICDELVSLLKRVKSVIFCPTVQSSGTWFVLELLKAHDQINWVIPKAYWQDSIIKELNIKGLIKDNGTVVLHIHFGEHIEKDQLVENIFNFSDHIVMPIRNPLKSLLTVHVRGGPDHDKRYIIHGYIKLVEWVKKYNIFLMPVDLYANRSRQDRYFLLRDLFDFVQLPYKKYMKEWANNWPIKNTVGPAGESVKLLFDTKNVEGIKEIMPDAFDLLMSSAPTLKPFFENQGYSKEDLWWW